MEGIKLKKFKMKKLEEMRLNPDIGPPTITIIGKRNSGKCLYAGTKIIMYDGSIKLVENIKIGDKLMGPDSKCRNVLSTTKGRDKLYKVKQVNGIDYIVNSKHILTLQKKEDNNIVDLEISEVLKQNPSNFLGLKSKAIQFKSQKVKLHPYRYGILYNWKNNIKQEYKINTINIRRNYIYGVFDKWGKKEELENGDYLFKFKRDIPTDLKWIAQSLGMNVLKKEIIIKKNSDYNTTDINIELLKFGDYYGFELVGDRRFLLNDFTITHNTYLEKDIMYTMRKVPDGIFMCPSAGGRESVGEIFPDTFIYNDLDLDLISKIMDAQEAKREKYGADLKKFDYSTAIICDDCAADRTIVRNNTIKNLLFNGRHKKIFFIFPTQDCKVMGPSQRDNMDFVFLCRSPSVDMRKSLHKTFFGIIPNFQDFCDILDRCTENYGCLVYDNTVKSNKIEDCIFWYKARSPMPKYKFGNKEFWDYHKKNQDKKKKKNKNKKKKVIIVKTDE